jgi:hypothetical protein
LQRPFTPIRFRVVLPDGQSFWRAFPAPIGGKDRRIKAMAVALIKPVAALVGPWQPVLLGKKIGVNTCNADGVPDGHNHQICGFAP